MHNHTSQQPGESEFTGESSGHNQANPHAQFKSTKQLSDWHGSISTFNGFTGTRPVSELENGTWGEICNLVRPEKPAVIAGKGQGQYFVPCLLKDAPFVGHTLETAISSGQPTIGKMRSKGHITEAAMLVIDIDGISRDAFYDMLNKVNDDGLTCVVYSTYSHGSADKPGVRARMIVPVDEPLSVEAYRSAWSGLDQQYFDGAAGKADASGANLYQQQGTWSCDPSRVSKAEKWMIEGGVASSDALIAIGNSILASQVAQPCTATQPTRKAPSPIGTKQATSSVSNAEYPPSDANKIAEACPQIRAFRNTKGANQSEPLWYDSLGIVGYCIDGEELCHQWSSGHKGYDICKTEEKMVYRMKTPPTTCAQFQKSNPAGCNGCLQKCNSPITLGWEDAFVVLEQPTIVVVTDDPANDLNAVGGNKVAPQNDDEVIASLAAMKPMEYERIRLEQAKRMGCRPAVLDELVKKARGENVQEDRPPFPTVEPHPEPVEPAALLDEIVTLIRRHIVLSDAQANAATLWITMTWFISTILVAPLALINAPEKSCGKTQLLDMIGRLSANYLFAANITAAVLFRLIERCSPTICIDEVDTFISQNDALKGIINAGHTRTSAYVWRIVGDNNEPKSFSVWAAKALAGIRLEKHLPDSTMSRGIVFNLRRKMAHETVERLRHADNTAFELLASKLARFALDYAEQVRRARPPIPEQLSDRAQDNWEPLLAIAQCAGPKWLQRATDAAIELSVVTDTSPSTGNEMLADIQHVFQKKNVTKISTVDLIEALCADEEAAWATYNRGKPLTPRQLAKQLTAYGISSKTVRLGHANTPKGFDVGQFADAFARYLAAPEKLPQHCNVSPESMGGIRVDVAGTNRVAATNDAGATLEPSQGLDCSEIEDDLPIEESWRRNGYTEADF